MYQRSLNTAHIHRTPVYCLRTKTQNLILWTSFSVNGKHRKKTTPSLTQFVPCYRHGGSGSIRSQSMWELCWQMGHSDKPLTEIFHPVSTVPLMVNTDSSTINSTATDSSSKRFTSLTTAKQSNLIFLFAFHTLMKRLWLLQALFVPAAVNSTHNSQYL